MKLLISQLRGWRNYANYDDGATTIIVNKEAIVNEFK